MQFGLKLEPQSLEPNEMGGGATALGRLGLISAKTISGGQNLNRERRVSFLFI